MKIYVKSSKDYEEKGIISSEGDMADFIHENYIIDNVIESVNDADYDWKYNTPEKFSAACKEYLTKNIASEIKDHGFKVKKGVDPVDLIGKDIWDLLKKEASKGDFDVDACSDVYASSNSINPMPTYTEVTNLLSDYGLELSSGGDFKRGAGKQNYYTLITIEAFNADNTDTSFGDSPLARRNYQAIADNGFQLHYSEADDIEAWLSDIFKSNYPNFNVSTHAYGMGDYALRIKIKLTFAKS